MHAVNYGFPDVAEEHIPTLPAVCNIETFRDWTPGTVEPSRLSSRQPMELSARGELQAMGLAFCAYSPQASLHDACRQVVERTTAALGREEMYGNSKHPREAYLAAKLLAAAQRSIRKRIFAHKPPLINKTQLGLVYPLSVYLDNRDQMPWMKPASSDWPWTRREFLRGTLPDGDEGPTSGRWCVLLGIEYESIVMPTKVITMEPDDEWPPPRFRGYPRWALAVLPQPRGPGQRQLHGGPFVRYVHARSSRAARVDRRSRPHRAAGDQVLSEMRRHLGFDLQFMLSGSETHRLIQLTGIPTERNPFNRESCRHDKFGRPWVDMSPGTCAPRYSREFQGIPGNLPGDSRGFSRGSQGIFQGIFQGIP